MLKGHNYIIRTISTVAGLSSLNEVIRYYTTLTEIIKRFNLKEEIAVFNRAGFKISNETIEQEIKRNENSSDK